MEPWRESAHNWLAGGPENAVFSVAAGEAFGLLAAISCSFLWVTLPRFLCDRPCSAATWHHVGATLEVFWPTVKAGPAVRYHGKTENVFFKKSEACGLAWAELRHPGCSLRSSARWTGRRFEGSTCPCVSCTLAGLEVGFFWFWLLLEPILLLFPAVLPSNRALRLLYQVQVILRLLQVPDLCYQPGGSCVASRRVGWVWAWESSSTCGARMGTVLCRAPVQCYPLLPSVEGELSHKPLRATQRSHFNFSLCWKHHTEKKMWSV